MIPLESVEKIQLKMKAQDTEATRCGTKKAVMATSLILRSFCIQTAHAKRRGKQAIHLGGPLQILFGIKGKRWDDIPSVSKFYNEYWTRPSDEETPVNNTKVEGGCYW